MTVKAFIPKLSQALCIQSFEMSKSNLGCYHPSTLASMKKLGLLYDNQCILPKASLYV
jgi:hypothetical protein